MTFIRLIVTTEEEGEGGDTLLVWQVLVYFSKYWSGLLSFSEDLPKPRIERVLQRYWHNLYHLSHQEAQSKFQLTIEMFKLLITIAQLLPESRTNLPSHLLGECLRVPITQYLCLWKVLFSPLTIQIRYMGGSVVYILNIYFPFTFNCLFKCLF